MQRIIAATSLLGLAVFLGFAVFVGCLVRQVGGRPHFAVTEARAAITFSSPGCTAGAGLFASLPSLPYARLELARARGIANYRPAGQAKRTF
ncbi:MAG TPA: hypothetical protein VF286_08565 [Acidiphilium sp.]